MSTTPNEHVTTDDVLNWAYALYRDTIGKDKGNSHTAIMYTHQRTVAAHLIVLLTQAENYSVWTDDPRAVEGYNDGSMAYLSPEEVARQISNRIERDSYVPPVLSAEEMADLEATIKSLGL